MIWFKRILKIILGCVLIAASGYLAFYLKDAIDAQSPEYSIVQITVSADAQVVDTEIGSYSWTFYSGKTAEKALASIYDLKIPETRVNAGAQLNISFSADPDTYTVRRSDSYSYQLLADGEETVPYEPGAYIYEVSAEFPEGIIIYYFYLLAE